MRKRYLSAFGVIALILIIFFIANNDFTTKVANGQDKEKSFEELLRLAQKHKKKIVINVYADWCSWCKKMEKSTFPDSEVQKELKRNYYFYRMNGESSDIIEYDGRKWTKAQLTHAFGIRGFPATIFLNYNSKPITVLPGYVDAKTFSNILKYIGDDIYIKMTFDEFMKGKKN